MRVRWRPVLSSGWTALAILTTALSAGIFRGVPCLGGKVDTPALFTRQCYSDIPVYYVGHGLSQSPDWFGGIARGFAAIEYPPLTGQFIGLMARLTHVIASFSGLRGSENEALIYYLVSGVTLSIVMLLSALFLGRLVARETWTISALLVAPVLVLESTVNWDALPLFCVVVALLAWRHKRLALFGIAVGLGIALKLYPGVMLVASVGLAVRGRSWRMALIPLGSALAAWVASNLALALVHGDQWLVFWKLNIERRADFGSVWVALRIIGLGTPTSTMNLVYGLGLLLVCLGVVVYAAKARGGVSVEGLSLVVLVGMLALNKVYSPQYSLWLLPLVVVYFSASWIALWSMAESAYFVAVWHYIVRVDNWHVQGIDKVYLLAIAARVAVQVVLAMLVLSGREVKRPMGHGSSRSRAH